MKMNQSKVISGLVLAFSLLSLFSFWNVFNWDILGWGTKLFLFPFLALIGFLAKLTPAKPVIFVRIQLGLLCLHALLYFWVFNFQDPHAPNLLLLLLSLFWSTLVLVYSKSHTLAHVQQPNNQNASVKRIRGLLIFAAILYLFMGVFAKPDFILPGIIIEVLALITYFVRLMRP
jgi:hypothetical protein